MYIFIRFVYLFFVFILRLRKIYWFEYVSYNGKLNDHPMYRYKKEYLNANISQILNTVSTTIILSTIAITITQVNLIYQAVTNIICGTDYSVTTKDYQIILILLLHY